jgi:hypothetical protein
MVKYLLFKSTTNRKCCTLCVTAQQLHSKGNLFFNVTKDLYVQYLYN